MTTGTTQQPGSAQSLFNDIRTTANAIEEGDWLEAAGGVAKVALDVISMDGDPLGAIASSGVSWVLGAVSFLREPFQVLKGDAGAISSTADSWNGASSGLGQTAQQYREASTSQTRLWAGNAADGYRSASTNQADGIAALSQASRGVSQATQQGGQLLASVRKAVMDLISEAVQQIIQICIEALAKSWMSFGASVAQGIAQSVQKAVQTGQKLMQAIQKLVSGLQKIMQTVQQIVQTAQSVKQLLEQIGGKASAAQPQTLAAPQTGGGTVPIPQGFGLTDSASAPVRLAQAGPELGALPPIPTVNGTPEGPVSQNGWPVNPPRGMRTIPGTNVRVNVADGPAGDVLMHVLGEVSRRVEDISMDSEAGERDDWGHAERNVRGGGDISNHASATAVDMNATRHVLGERGTFTTEQTTEIRAILGEVDNVVRWGGDYQGRADEMHFEIVGSVEEVTAVAQRLRNANAQ
ncbi:M15 family metallopeptidase [Actinophytocola sediminis]